MLLTISTGHQPATDLGFLLHKNPARTQTEELPFGKAHVFYPEASAERCTVALLLDIDPVALVRGRGPAGEGGQLEHYVNDRPYAANSFLSVAIGRVFATAMGGRSKDRPELADTPIPLIAHLPVIAARGGQELVSRLFEPLGYSVDVQGSLLDEQFPEWGDSPYVSLQLTATARLQDLLTHLCVLIPVLDNEKHYWVANDEIEKLLKRGEGWLGAHPEKDLIVSRYLKRQRHLTREALSRLLMEEPSADDALQSVTAEADEAEQAPSLHQQRLQSVLAVIKASGAQRVLDLGCGEGKLLRLLLAEKQFDQIVGMDVSWRSLGEGMVAKPLNFIAEGRRGITQPAIKCRGPEYLRIIYGPEYLLPGNLERLRSRNVGAKRSLASREFALGVEALERFVRKEPLRLIHECVFGVLALESEPIDPRL